MVKLGSFPGRTSFTSSLQDSINIRLLINIISKKLLNLNIDTI